MTRKTAAAQISFADLERQNTTRADVGRRIRELLNSYNELPAEDALMSITGAADAAEILMAALGHLEQEELHVMLLDNRNHVLGITFVYKGSVNSAQIRICEVFREAVKANAVSIIIAHNHPSGKSDPSPEDIRVTREIVAAGKILDIRVADHLVIGRDCFTSLRSIRKGFEAA